MARFINIIPEINDCIFSIFSEQTTIIFYDCEFIIIRHNAMMSKYEFLEEVFKNLNSNFKHKTKTLRGIVTNKDLRDLRIREIKLQRHFDEINYLYKDNSGKEYCFYTRKKFKEKWLNNYNEKLETELQKTIELLNEKKLNHLKKEVLELANENKIYDFTTPEELFKTIEHFSKSLKKKKL